jgi:hypothetical protein
MRRASLLTAMAVLLSLWTPRLVSQDTSRLTEPREQSANSIQPPALVMDLIGIRPGSRETGI